MSRTPPPVATEPGAQHDDSVRIKYELAGGLEDWEDVDSADVDRYGFISTRKPGSRAVTPDSGAGAAGEGAGTPASHLAPPPRKRNVLTKRPNTSNSASHLSPPMHTFDKNISARSLHTQASQQSTASRRTARGTLRQATNRLPHNSERRRIDEAGEMLTLTPGLSDIAEDEQAGRISEALKRKEWERSEKWAKMAKVTSKSREGEGMDFEFDVRNQKLIERTWKGIPDRWRAAAWYSFLATSARNAKSSETDHFLVTEFRRWQEVTSPDDIQIDMDVPRTINKHIMFRQRYRGGQRLLFRVLHALSLHFPIVGYVQGMASLAATLLCYYDEERAFVMLVRMWRHRGLERLYRPGFDGLMSALREFEDIWLAGKDAARKLNELCIDSTAYGTRWYLTLFNLSIPFAAQLRVWDVFMLLGECDAEEEEPRTPSVEAAAEKGKQKARSSTRGFDVLHATATALIDALAEVLLDSDFENAMKAMTSWVPIKDEEMLMRVAKAEWKRHHDRPARRKG